VCAVQTSRRIGLGALDAAAAAVNRHKPLPTSRPAVPLPARSPGAFPALLRSALIAQAALAEAGEAAAADFQDPNKIVMQAAAVGLMHLCTMVGAAGVACRFSMCPLVCSVNSEARKESSPLPSSAFCPVTLAPCQLAALSAPASPQASFPRKDATPSGAFLRQGGLALSLPCRPARCRCRTCSCTASY
jgi:hypothetical protein